MVGHVRSSPPEGGHDDVQRIPKVRPFKRKRGLALADQPPLARRSRTVRHALRPAHVFASSVLDAITLPFPGEPVQCQSSCHPDAVGCPHLRSRLASFRLHCLTAVSGTRGILAIPTLLRACLAAACGGDPLWRRRSGNLQAVSSLSVFRQPQCEGLMKA
jgi:hypothetical protein